MKQCTLFKAALRFTGSGHAVAAWKTGHHTNKKNDCSTGS